MSPADTFPAQLAAILEALANAAVAEICELVDSEHALLRLEVSRRRKENEALRRKLRLAELRATRAATTAGGNACGNACGARAQLAARHPGNEPRRTRAGEAAPTPEPSSHSGLEALWGPGGEGGSWLSCGPPQPPPPPPAPAPQLLPPRGPAGEVTVIKVEDNDDDEEEEEEEEDEEESWSPPEQNRDFPHVADGQVTDTEAPPPMSTQEVAEDGGGASPSTSTSTSTQETPHTVLDRGRSGIYDGVMLAPLQEPSCSFAATQFHFGATRDHQKLTGVQNHQQRAPQRKEEMGRQDRWRAQGDGGGRGGKAFVCNCCGKSLACRKNLKTHMRVHTGEKPFVCALCGMCFSDSSNLKRHQSVHTGEKRYGCVHCGKRFAQSGSLKVHMTVHTDCKQFRCSLCSKTFISGSHLRRHVTAHTAESQ